MDIVSGNTEKHFFRQAKDHPLQSVQPFRLKIIWPLQANPYAFQAFHVFKQPQFYKY